MDKHLHIVSLDVPYPPDYGGVFDLFYKLKALYDNGVKIHLHCFEYGRGQQPKLNKYCESVNYYKRKLRLKGFSFRLPYIVSSRNNGDLINNLMKDDYPVLLEGIHCTYFLNNNSLRDKKVFVRLHNIESAYYRELAGSENNLFKKLFYINESHLLKKYERNIAGKATFICVSQKDAQVFKKDFPASNVLYLPVFLPYARVNSKIGKGNFCLYHGNLSIAENENAAVWLLDKVFHELLVTFIIAGKHPSESLKKKVAQKDNATLFADLSANEMEEIIRNAQLHVIPSFNTTGIKIKLLNALFNGRHCLVNSRTVEETGLEHLCHIADEANTFSEKLLELFPLAFDNYDIEDRKLILETEYDNDKNAQQLMQWIY
ncbi:MAG: glycosyltransferase [Chitinophagaceae bacterium]|nr:glycosyltransferase [Chitinophagaceae bacterium]